MWPTWSKVTQWRVRAAGGEYIHVVSCRITSVPSNSTLWSANQPGNLQTMMCCYRALWLARVGRGGCWHSFKTSVKSRFISYFKKKQSTLIFTPILTSPYLSHYNKGSTVGKLRYVRQTKTILGLKHICFSGKKILYMKWANPNHAVLHHIK